MHIIRENAAVLLAAAALIALTLAATGQSSAQAASVRHSTARTCDWRIFHRIDKYTSWRYVSPRLAAYEHVGRCSKVISGTDGSVVFSQRGYAIDVS